MGHARKLRGRLRANIKELEAEVHIYDSLLTVSERPPPYIDVLKPLAGSSKLTLTAKDYGLNALEPMDLHHGPDLFSDQGQQQARKAISKFKPWLCVMGLDCMRYSQPNHNLNYSHSEDE